MTTPVNGKKAFTFRVERIDDNCVFYPNEAKDGQRISYNILCDSENYRISPESEGSYLINGERLTDRRWFKPEKVKYIRIIPSFWRYGYGFRLSLSTGTPKEVLVDRKSLDVPESGEDCLRQRRGDENYDNLNEEYSDVQIGLMGDECLSEINSDDVLTYEMQSRPYRLAGRLYLGIAPLAHMSNPLLNGTELKGLFEFCYGRDLDGTHGPIFNMGAELALGGSVFKLYARGINTNLPGFAEERYWTAQMGMRLTFDEIISIFTGYDYNVGGVEFGFDYELAGKKRHVDVEYKDETYIYPNISNRIYAFQRSEREFLGALDSGVGVDGALRDINTIFNDISFYSKSSEELHLKEEFRRKLEFYKKLSRTIGDDFLCFTGSQISPYNYQDAELRALSIDEPNIERIKKYLEKRRTAKKNIELYLYAERRLYESVLQGITLQNLGSYEENFNAALVQLDYLQKTTLINSGEIDKRRIALSLFVEKVKELASILENYNPARYKMIRLKLDRFSMSLASFQTQFPNPVNKYFIKFIEQVELSIKRINDYYSLSEINSLEYRLNAKTKEFILAMNNIVSRSAGNLNTLESLLKEIEDMAAEIKAGYIKMDKRDKAENIEQRLIIYRKMLEALKYSFEIFLELRKSSFDTAKYNLWLQSLPIYKSVGETEDLLSRSNLSSEEKVEIRHYFVGIEALSAGLVKLVKIEEAFYRLMLTLFLNRNEVNILRLSEIGSELSDNFRSLEAFISSEDSQEFALRKRVASGYIGLISKVKDIGLLLSDGESGAAIILIDRLLQEISEYREDDTHCYSENTLIKEIKRVQSSVARKADDADLSNLRSKAIDAEFVFYRAFKSVMFNPLSNYIYTREYNDAINMWRELLRRVPQQSSERDKISEKIRKLNECKKLMEDMRILRDVVQRRVRKSPRELNEILIRIEVKLKEYSIGGKAMELVKRFKKRK